MGLYPTSPHFATFFRHLPPPPCHAPHRGSSATPRGGPCGGTGRSLMEHLPTPATTGGLRGAAGRTPGSTWGEVERDGRAPGLMRGAKWAAGGWGHGGRPYGHSATSLAGRSDQARMPGLASWRRGAEARPAVTSRRHRVESRPVAASGRRRSSTLPAAPGAAGAAAHSGAGIVILVPTLRLLRLSLGFASRI